MLVAARRRLRETRRYADRRGIAFDLDLLTVRRMVEQAWPADDGLALTRLDRRGGFSPDNVALVPTRGGRPRRTTNARLRRRFERLAARGDLSGLVSVEDLALLFAAQKARCAISGRILRPGARLSDPDGISVVLANPTRRPSPRNILLVTTCVAELANRWGLDELVALARDIVRAQRRAR